MSGIILLFQFLKILLASWCYVNIYEEKRPINVGLVLECLKTIESLKQTNAFLRRQVKRGVPIYAFKNQEWYKQHLHSSLLSHCQVLVMKSKLFCFCYLTCWMIGFLIWLFVFLIYFIHLILFCNSPLD